MLAKKHFGKELGFTFVSKSSRKRQLGFTLIELLVVIAIISILAVFLFVSFTQVQKSSRDAQRKSDLQTVAGALQRFYSDNSHYPDDSSGKITYDSTNCTNTTPDRTEVWGTNGITCTVSGSSKTYIKQLPKNPAGALEYCYSSADDQHYILYTVLEGSGTTGTYTNPSGCPSGTYNYQVTAQD